MRWILIYHWRELLCELPVCCLWIALFGLDGITIWFSARVVSISFTKSGNSYEITGSLINYLQTITFKMDLRQSIHQVLVLLLFKFSKDLDVGIRLLKILSSNSSYIIELRVARLRSTLNLNAKFLQFSFCTLALILDFLAASLQFILFVSNLHHFARCTLEILL